MARTRVVYEETFSRKNGSRYCIQLVKPPVADVHLISYPHSARQLIGKVANLYKGQIDAKDIPENEIEDALSDMANTRLTDPLNMVHTTWLFSGVTRAFTHQLVRYAIGTRYAQESMRFYGSKNTYRVLIPPKLAVNEAAKGVYTNGINCALIAYEDLLALGASSEDARGVIPTNILTHIFADLSLGTIAHVFTQRVCCQAQTSEWVPLLLEMRRQIALTLGPDVADLIKANVELGKPCGYNASFDRPCTWQNGVKLEENK